MSALWLLGLLLGGAWLMQQRCSAAKSLALVAVYLLLMGFFGQTPHWLLALLWLLWLFPVALHALPDLRRRRVSAPLLAWLRRNLPPLSDTEREAIEAGSVWWDGQLFSGRPDWQQLFAYPTPSLSDEERDFLAGPVEELCRMVDDWQVGEQADLPEAAWRFIRERGFFALIIPREYGGKGFSALAHSQIAMKLASRCSDLASTVIVPNSLGPAELLLHYGTEAQRSHYLPRLARGEEIPCFALTSPLAGSDAGAMPDFGIVCRGTWQGEEVLGLRLTWEKRYITLGPCATLLGLAFKAFDPDHLLGEQEELGISLVLIPTDTPGVKIGRRHQPLYAALQNGPNSGREVFIPLEQVIGGREMLGKGWMMLMNCLSVGRSISLPAAATGAAKLACLTSAAYAQVREQFNRPIGDFEGIQEALARMAGRTFVMDCARRMTAGAVDLGEKPAVLSAIVKYHLTERARQCLNDAMDIHAGKGICQGPNNYLARSWMSMPISITVEGANILTRNLMIFGQGAIRCHPFVLREMQLANAADQQAALPEFDALLLEHLGFSLSNAASALLLGLGVPTLRPRPGDARMGRHLRDIERLAAGFALLAELALLLLGGELKRRERLSARLGDVLSHLYLASACLKRFDEQGRPDGLVPLLEWAMADNLRRAESALDQVRRNLPLRPLRGLLYPLLFPAGRRHHGPDDALEGSLARLLMSDDTSTAVLLEDCFQPDDPTEPVGALLHALQLREAAQPVERKLRQLQRDGQLPDSPPDDPLRAAEQSGALDADELATLHAWRAAQRRVIDVDDFDPQQLARHGPVS